jgi:hypothetical protein
MGSSVDSNRSYFSIKTCLAQFNGNGLSHRESALRLHTLVAHEYGRKPSQILTQHIAIRVRALEGIQRVDASHRQ